MEVFLPSDIARLVYGYLLDESCLLAAKEFLETSTNMKECAIVVKRGQSFHTKVSGRTLIELMDIFSEIVHLVNLFIKNSGNIDQSAVNFVEKVCNLLGLGSEFSPLKDKLNNPRESFVGENVVTIPGPLEADDDDNYGPPSHVSTPKDKNIHDDSSIDLAIFDTLLNKTAFHEKLADNINKAITSSEVQYEEKEKSPLKESSIVKAALTTTEADPLFEEVINEIIGAAPTAEDHTTESSETGAGNNKENKKPSESEGSREAVVDRRPSLVELAMEGCVDRLEEATPIPILQSPLSQALLIQVLPADASITRPSQEPRPYRSILPKPTLGPIIEPIASKISVSSKIGGVRTRGGIRRMKTRQRVCSLVPNINTLEDGKVVANFTEEPASSIVLRRSLRKQGKVPLSTLPEEVESEPKLSVNNQESQSSVDQHKLLLDSFGSQNDREVSTELRNCKPRQSEAVNEVVETTKSISAENNKIDDFSGMADKETPVVRTKSVVKKSLSSPRKGSHVRVLDFKTPIKGVPARKANTSPKAVSQGKLSQFRALRRVTLFKSPPKKDISSWDKDLRTFVEADIPLLSKNVSKFNKKKVGRPRTRIRPSPAKGRRRRITRKTRSIDEPSEPSESDCNMSTAKTNDDIIEEIRNDVFNTILLDSQPAEEDTSVDKNSSLKFDKSPNVHNHDDVGNETSPSQTHSELTEVTHDLVIDRLSVETVTDKINVELTHAMTVKHVEFPAPSQLLMKEKVLKTPAKSPAETDYELTPVSKILKEQTSLLDRTVLLTPGLPPTPQIAEINYNRPLTPEEFRSQPTPPPPDLESPNTSLQNTLINECMRIEEDIRVEEEHRRTSSQSLDPKSSPVMSEIPSLVISMSPQHMSSTTVSKSSTVFSAESSSQVLTCQLNSTVSLNTESIKPSKVGLPNNKKRKNKPLTVMESPAIDLLIKTPEKVVLSEGATKKSNKHKIKLKLPKTRTIHPSTISTNSLSPGKLSTSRENCDSQVDEIIKKCYRDMATSLFEGENTSVLSETPHESERTQSKKRKSTPNQSKIPENSPVLNKTPQKSEKNISITSKSPPDKSKVESPTTTSKPKKPSLNSSKTKKEVSKLTLSATRKKEVDLNALPTFKDIMEKLKTPSMPVSSDPVTSISKDDDIDSNDTFPRLQVSEDSCSLSPLTNNENSSVCSNVKNSHEIAEPSCSKRNNVSCGISTKECSVVITPVSPSKLGNNKSSRELIKDFSWINNHHTNIREHCHLSYFDEDTQTERNLKLSPMITCFEYPFPSFKDRDKTVSKEKRTSNLKNPCEPDQVRTHTLERNSEQTFSTLKSDVKIDSKSNEPREKVCIRSPVSSPHRAEKYRHKNLPRILERRDYIRHPLQRHRARMRGESASRELYSRTQRSHWSPGRVDLDQRRRRNRDIRVEEKNRRREDGRLRRGMDQYKDRYLRAPVSPDRAHRSPNGSRIKDYSSMHCRESLRSNGYRNSRHNGDIYSLRSNKKQDEKMFHTGEHHNLKSRTVTEPGNLDSITRSRQDKELRSRLSPPRDPRRVASLRDSSSSLSASEDAHLHKDPRLRIRPSHHSTPKDSHSQHKPLPSAKRRHSVDREEGEISDCDTMSIGSISTSKKRNTGSPCEETEVLNRGKSLLKNVDVDRFLSIVHGSP